MLKTSNCKYSYKEPFCLESFLNDVSKVIIVNTFIFLCYYNDVKVLSALIALFFIVFLKDVYCWQFFQCRAKGLFLLNFKNDYSAIKCDLLNLRSAFKSLVLTWSTEYKTIALLSCIFVLILLTYFSFAFSAEWTYAVSDCLSSTQRFYALENLQNSSAY